MSARPSQIENRNFLAPTGFKFTLKRSPGVAFFCNQANIPDLNLGIAIQPNYLRDIPTPGDKVEFGDLNLRFLVDESLENFMEVQKWIRGLGYPEDVQEFRDLEKSGLVQGNYANDRQNVYSDGTLQILNSNLVAQFNVFFTDLFPYALTTLTFDATDTDIQYFTADVSFKYTSYKITDLELEMTFDLDVIQGMWEKDSKIDMDNLHTESTNIPTLHAKYFEMYNTIFLLRKKAEQQRKNIRHERYEYFSGKADPDVYVENPFPKKIRDKDTMQKYLDADEKLSTVCLKIDYYDTMLVYIESILKQVTNRTYQIKNAIEFMRFNAGLG